MNKSIVTTNDGQILTIQIPFNERKVFVLPKSCIHCPVGFHTKTCGRSFPMSDENYERRPDNCDLKLVTISEYIEERSS